MSIFLVPSASAGFKRPHLRGSAAKARLYTVLTAGAAKRRGTVLSLTTAGSDLDDGSPWAQVHTRAKKHLAGEDTDPRFLPIVFEAPESVTVKDDDATLLAGLRAANPAMGFIRDEDEALRITRSLPEWEATRYMLNRVHLRDEESWLPKGSWQECAKGFEAIPPGSVVWAGVDIALKHDTSAVVVAWPQWPEDPNGDPIITVEATIWEAGSEGSIDHTAIEYHLRDLAKRFTLAEVVADPSYFQASLQKLADDGLPVTEVPQSPARMVRVVAAAREAIAAGRVRHPGDAEFSRQVIDARPRWTDAGMTLRKPRPVDDRPRAHIDAAIAMALAVWASTQHRGEWTSPAEERPRIFNPADLLRHLED